MNKNTVKRSVLKTLTYRIIGTITTSLTGYIITGNLMYGLAMGGIDVISKMIIYFIHERIWQNIDYGRNS